MYFGFTLLSMSPIIPVSAEASLKLVLEVFLVALATGKLPPESWRDKPTDPVWENWKLKIIIKSARHFRKKIQACQKRELKLSVWYEAYFRGSKLDFRIKLNIISRKLLYFVNRPNAESTKIRHNFRKQKFWKLESRIFFFRKKWSPKSILK